MRADAPVVRKVKSDAGDRVVALGRHPQAISDRLDKLVADSGLPPVRLHDLRHRAATYMRHDGADLKEIQEVFGHSTIGLTSDTCTSLILDLRRSNAGAAARLIARAVV